MVWKMSVKDSWQPKGLDPCLLWFSRQRELHKTVRSRSKSAAYLSGQGARFDHQPRRTLPKGAALKVVGAELN